MIVIKSIKIFLVLTLLSTISAWSVDISTWQKSYKVTETTWIKLDNKPGNEKDWIGIYPKRSSSEWKNLVAWKWVKNDSHAYPNWYDFSILEAGEYEARFFLNDTFEADKKVSFVVTNGSNGVRLSSWHSHYKTTESAWIKLENRPGNEEDWIGIYPEGSSSTWENIIVWKWVKDDSSEYPTWYAFSGLKAGKYEARFFLNNSFDVEKKVKFTIGNNTASIKP